MFLYMRGLKTLGVQEIDCMCNSGSHQLVYSEYTNRSFNDQSTNCGISLDFLLTVTKTNLEFYKSTQ